MSSVNENTPCKNASSTNNETYETTASSSSSSSNVTLDVHALKERIIATNKLFKYLQDAKKELSARETQISTLNTNLGLSVKKFQESDEKYKKSAEQVKSLENQLKEKSSQVDTITENNKILKIDLRKQADLAKRMGSSAAEFRMTKIQVTKLTEENQLLQESLSKLQAEKDQLDEDAMETSINHDLTIESLQEEITDLKSSLTSDDSALVSLKLQLSNEKNRTSKADAHVKSLEHSLLQSNEQIKQLNAQLLQKRHQQASTPVSDTNHLDNMKRMHAEEMSSLKRKILQLNTELATKAIVPSTPQSSSNPDFLRKYHELKGKYQLMKKTNGFLNLQLQAVLSNASKKRGLESDSDSDDMSPEFGNDMAMVVDFETTASETSSSTQKSFTLPRQIASNNLPIAVDLESQASEPTASSTVASQKSSVFSRSRSCNPMPEIVPVVGSSSMQKSLAVPSRPSNTNKASPVAIVIHNVPKVPRLAHQQHKPITEESGIQQKSGLVAPPSRTIATKLPKKRKSLLEKFATAKNPSKVLERAKAPTSFSIPPLALSKKRPHSDESTSEPTFNSAALDNTATGNPSKKAKPDYHWNHVIEGIFNRDNGRVLPTREECKEITPKLLDEIQDCYARIKSVAVLADANLVPFGDSDLELPKSMDHREKSYAWFLVSLLKVDREEFDQFMFKLGEVIKICPLNKTPINNKLVRFIRLFVVACKAENSLSRLRILMYALFRTRTFHPTIIPSLVNAGSIWKESFVFKSTDPHFETLHTTFISCVHFICSRSSSASKNIKGTYEQLRTMFSWPPHPKRVLECVEDSMTILQSTFIKELHTSDRYAFDLLSFNLTTSFELAFIILDDWKQTYDIFIRTKLWPLLGMETIDVVAMELLGVLARLGVSDDPLKPDKPGVVTLLDTFSTIVGLGESINPNEKHLLFAATKSMAAVAGNHYQYRQFLGNIHDI